MAAFRSSMVKLPTLTTTLSDELATATFTPPDSATTLRLSAIHGRLLLTTVRLTDDGEV